MYCFFCGTENKDDNQYCIKCGKSLHPKSVEDEIAANKGKKRTVLILTAVFATAVLIGIAICLVIYNKNYTDDNITKDTAEENVANIIEQSSEERKEKSEDNKNVDETDADDDSVNSNDGEIVPTTVEKKYIEEADKLLEQDDPLSAAEVLTAAMEEDYYPAIYEKYKEIRRKTVDHEKHTIGNELDGSSYENIWITEYEDGIKKSEKITSTRDGERIEDKTTEYSEDKDGNSVKLITDNINSNVTRYVTVEEEYGKEKTLREYLGDTSGIITREDKYVDGKLVSLKTYSETTGDLMSEILPEYDKNGFEIKRTTKDAGDKPPKVSEYQNDKYGRVVISGGDTIYYTNEIKYDYNATGFTEHQEIIQKKDVDVPEGNYVKSSYDCVHDALGGAIHSESRVWQSDGTITGSNAQYTHDYHYYNGDNDNERKDQSKTDSKDYGG